MPPRSRARQQIAEDLKWLYSDVRGRRILWRLWQSTGVFGPPVVDNAMQAFAEGRRSVGLEYWQGIVTQSPTAAAMALTENTGSAVDGGRKRDTDTSRERRELLERWADVAGAGDQPGDGPADTPA